MSCPECRKAATNGHHRCYRAECPECVVRQLATGTQEGREAAYDHAEKWIGPHASKAIRELVSAEWARIKLLRSKSNKRL